MHNWNQRFIDLAYVVASWSKDPSTKVGAVIVRPDNTIASVGYNGFPRGIEDDDRLNDRAKKYPRVVHAEVNAILNAHERVKWCSIYTTLHPCCDCAKFIIQAGIDAVYFDPYTPPHMKESKNWVDSLSVAKDMFSEAGVLSFLVPQSP